MKKLFVAVILFSNLSFADQNILCYNGDRSESFNINTKTGKILFNNQYPVTGAVYSGVNSNTNYSGEVLGEININGANYYITLIIRNINGHLSIESQLYPITGNTEISINQYSDCTLQ